MDSAHERRIEERAREILVDVEAATPDQRTRARELAARGLELDEERDRLIESGVDPAELEPLRAPGGRGGSAEG